jgi:hypothetical protein
MQLLDHSCQSGADTAPAHVKPSQAKLPNRIDQFHVPAFASASEGQAPTSSVGSMKCAGGAALA